MAVKGGPEAVVEAVAATLVAHFNDQLAAVWTAWDDGGTVPQVPPRHIYAFGREVIPEYPAIEVDWLPGRQLANMAPVYGEVDHGVVVIAWLAADDVPTLRKQTARYAWAIWRTLMQQQRLDGSLTGLAGVDPIRLVDGDMGKHAKGARSVFVQPVSWEVLVHVEESAQ